MEEETLAVLLLKYNMSKINENLKYLMDKAESLGITFEILDTKPQIILAKKDNRAISIYKSKLPLNSSGAAKISKDKNLTKIILAKTGINVPKGILVKELDGLEHVLSESALRYPLVVKPNDEALGSGVTANLLDLEEVKKTVNGLGSTGRTEIVIEEYFEGEDHRFLVLDGKVLAVAKRVRPKVVGDGKRTIKELIDTYNVGRLHAVPFDNEVERYLSMQGYTLESVPEFGKEIILRGNSNYRTGGRSQDATDIVAEGYKKIAESAATTLGLRLAGVDILIKDDTKFGDYVVTEVNSVPGFDVHMAPDDGESREDILEKIWSAIFE